MIDMSKELYQRIDETLHYIWDPIGVSGAPQARDEYYGYLPKVEEAIRRGDSKEDVIRLLNTIATDNMGLTAADWLTTRTHHAVDRIFEWKDYLKEKQDNLNDMPK